MTSFQVVLAASLLAGAAAGADPRTAPKTPAEPLPGLPSVLADISCKFINAVVERPIERIEPVRERILDAEVFGTGKTIGNVFIRLKPSCDVGALEFVFQGVTYSKTIGYQNPVRAFSRSEVHFEVRKPLYLDACGLQGKPARACAKAEVCLLGLVDLTGNPDTNISDFGRDEFRRTRWEIELDTARKAECRLAPRVDQDLQATLDKVNAGLDKLRKLNVPLLPFHWVSTPSRLELQVSLANVTPIASPPPVPEPADLALRLHHGALREAARHRLGGKTVSLVELGGIAEGLLGPVLGGKKTAAGAETLGSFLKTVGADVPTISFAAKDPVLVTFGKDRFTVVIHGTGFTSGKSKYPARTVRVEYKIEKSPEGFVAVREGTPEVRPPSVLDMSDEATDKSTRAFLQTTFSLFFRDRLVLSEMILPLEEQTLVLQPRRADMADGWLLIVWNRRLAATR